MSSASTTVSLATALVATTSAGLFAGGALYISAVQHPALLRSALTNTSRAAFFSSMFGLAASMQATLVGISGLAAVTTGVLLHPQSHSAAIGRVSGSSSSLLWIISGSAMAAIIPYTMATMMALNKKLIDTAFCAKQSDQWLDDAFRRWAKLHSVRTGVSVAAFMGMVAALSRGQHSQF